MKFVIAALIGAISASQINIPTIQWNEAKINQIGQTIQAADQSVAAKAQADQQASLQDFTKSIARYRVGEYASFGKNMKPFAELDVAMIDNLTVTGVCNRAIATECVNEYYWGRSTRAATETCFEQKAGCTSKWTTMTDVQKQALATKFQTSVQTIELAYQKLNQRFVQDLTAAHQAHQARKQVMAAEVKLAARNVATQFGCNMTCMDTKNCSPQAVPEPAQCLFNAMQACGCGNGVIKVTPTPVRVNNFAIAKETFGDLNNLTEEEIETVNDILEF